MISPEQIASQINYATQNGWLAHYQEAANYYGIPIEILLAKDSRESGLGTVPGLVQNSWYGSDGKSRGISQINSSVYNFARDTDPNDIRAYVAKGAEILAKEYKTFGNWKHALSAYNTGPNDVRSAIASNIDPDIYTTDKDYGADVIYRSNLIKQLSSQGAVSVPIKSASLDGKVILGLGFLAGIIYLAKRLDYV